jgi:NAD(P)-dependent dehydrogenase (short-subunit alcohol dehydrogenase family)
MSKLFDLHNKNVLLTGASKGMGLAMAQGLVNHGANVVISSRKLDQCQKAVDTVNESVQQEKAFAFSCNASSKDELSALVDFSMSKLGSISTLVCNAGVNSFFGSMSEIDDESYDKTMNTNVKSNHWLINMVSPSMKESGGGSIMITSSIAAFDASETLGAYSISKLAVLGLVRNYASELGPSNIRVNAICPGLVKTDFSKLLWENPDAERATSQRMPLRRLGEADDFMGVAVFLASDESSFMTGQALTICGGASMWS